MKQLSSNETFPVPLIQKYIFILALLRALYAMLNYKFQQDQVLKYAPGNSSPGINLPFC